MSIKSFLFCNYPFYFTNKGCWITSPGYLFKYEQCQKQETGNKFKSATQKIAEKNIMDKFHTFYLESVVAG